jgi:polysaccharide export outer membrane protein
MSLRRLLESPIRLLAVTLSASSLVVACADPGGYANPSFATRAADSRPDRTFRIGIGDKLKVTVFGEDNLTSQVEVNASGAIAMPLIGEVQVKDRSIGEVKELLVRRLGDGYLKNPRINVEVMNFRPIYVHGEVKSGGEFAYKNGLTLRDAIAMAGGYTYRAQQGYLLLVREGRQEERIPLPSTLPVLPGDNIRIPERLF